MPNRKSSSIVDDLVSFKQAEADFILKAKPSCAISTVHAKICLSVYQILTPST